MNNYINNLLNSITNFSIYHICFISKLNLTQYTILLENISICAISIRSFSIST